MALADTAKLIASLELQDKFTGPANRVGLSLGRLESGMSRMGRGAGQVAAGLGRIGLIGATAAAGGLVAVAKVAGDFEAQLNTINTIVKLTDRDLKALGEGIRATFRETGEPLEDLTAAYYSLLSAGIKVEDAQSVLNTSVKLGIGGLATTAEAVDLMTTAINAYALNASGAAAASDIFAAAVRDGKVTVADLNASFANVAPIAATVGVKLEEIGAAYAVLTARGVEATEVGTQFNRSIIELLKPGPELVKVMKSLGLTSFETSIRQKGLVATLQDAREEAERLGIPFQDLFGRIEAYKFALATTGPNQAAFNSGLLKMGDATGEANAQFAERQQGLNFQIAKLKALAQDAGITIGNALLPKLVPLVTKLNDFITENQGKIAEFGEKLAAGFGTFADRLQKTDFSGVISGLQLLGTVGKKVVDIFLSLPAGVQSALVAGFAVNKLSGGLIGSGVGNIAGGLIKLVFERGASPANPLWVQSVVGGVGGGAPVAAAGRGFLGTAAKFILGPAAAVAIGAEIAAVINEKVIGPAAASEEAKVNAVLDSKSVGDINNAIDRISEQQNTDDILAQTALIASNIPFIEDALGHVGPKLDEQRKALEEARAAIVDATGNASSSSNAWSAKQLAAFAQLTPEMRNAASAARATTSATQVLQQRVSEARNAINASNASISARVSATTGAVREGTGVLRSLAGKKGDVIVKLTSNVSVSISDIQRKITSQQIAVGKGPLESF